MAEESKDVKSKPYLHQDYIDPHAYGIVKALQRNGYTTYLVGGCVRDLLLGLHPKDFDIATDARPNQVKRLIQMAFVIGRRFRLVLVKRQDQQYEVATFRRDLQPGEELAEGFSPDNLFGTPEEDAKRRDFTINSLFYDPIKNELIDFCRGTEDLRERWIRMIGDPEKRLIEDSIRSLRALRLAHKINFSIEPSFREAMQTRASDLIQSVLPRRREEILKLLRLDEPHLAFLEAHDLGILQAILPSLDELFREPERLEKFLYHFSALSPHHWFDSDFFDQPTALYLRLISAFELSSMPDEKMKFRDFETLMADERLQKMMRDELGMFKVEQAQVCRALEFHNLLLDSERFKKRGDRRLKALCLNEAFPFAMSVAWSLKWISPSDWLFWWSRFEGLLNDDSEPDTDEEDPEARAEGAPPRRRRRRRRKPRTDMQPQDKNPDSL